jgi:hypothetical protein
VDHPQNDYAAIYFFDSCQKGPVLPISLNDAIISMAYCQA